MERPEVSVLIPAYNHDRYVRDAIESVWQQTFRCLELIVIDDGSRDRTRIIAEELSARAPIRMTVVRRENRGLCATLNEALALSSGRWIAFLASDDYYLPQFIETNYRIAVASVDHAHLVLHSDAWMMDENGIRSGLVSEVSDTPPVRGTNALRQLAWNSQSVIVPATLFVSRDLLRACGGFDESMKAEDYDIHLRLSRSARFEYVGQPLYSSRVIQGSLGRKPWLWAEDIEQALRKHEDLLGQELQPILAKRRADVSLACFSHGAASLGLRWAHKSFKARSGAERWRHVPFFAVKAVLATLRYEAVRWLPGRLVTLVRRIKSFAKRRAAQGRRA